MTTTFANVTNSALHGAVARWPSAATCHAITRGAFALLLLTSAILKAQQLMTTPFDDVSRADPSLAWWSWNILTIEILFLFGGWLASGLRVSLSWPLAVLLFAIMACVSLLGIVRREPSCPSCFGTYALSSWYTLAIDLTAIGTAVLFPPVPSSSARRTGKRLIGRAVGPTVLTAAAAGGLWLSSFQPIVLQATDEPAAVSISDARALLLRPNGWIGSARPLLPHVVVEGDVVGGDVPAADLSRGQWLLVLGYAGCSVCDAILPEYARLAQEMATSPPTRLAVINVKQRSSSPSSSVERFHREGTIAALGHLDPSRSWHVAAPSVIALSDGIVQDAVEGAVPGTASMLREGLLSHGASAEKEPPSEVQQLTPEEPPELPPSRAPAVSDLPASSS